MSIIGRLFENAAREKPHGHRDSAAHIEVECIVPVPAGDPPVILHALPQCQRDAHAVAFEKSGRMFFRYGLTVRGHLLYSGAIRT